MITLEDLATISKTEIEIYYGSGNAGPWIAHFRKRFGSEVFFKRDESDCMQRSCTGWGSSPEKALSDLRERLNAHEYAIMVVVSGDDRQKFGVPKIGANE